MLLWIFLTSCKLLYCDLLTGGCCIYHAQISSCQAPKALHGTTCYGNAPCVCCMSWHGVNNYFWVKYSRFISLLISSVVMSSWNTKTHILDETMLKSSISTIININLWTFSTQYSQSHSTLIQGHALVVNRRTMACKFKKKLTPGCTLLASWHQEKKKKDKNIVKVSWMGILLLFIMFLFHCFVKVKFN